MLVNLEDLLLMDSQIVGALFKTNQHLRIDRIFWLSRLSLVFRENTYDVGVRFKAEGSGSLLDSFLSVINLFQAQGERDFEVMLTWRILPLGSKTVQFVL